MEFWNGSTVGTQNFVSNPVHFYSNPGIYTVELTVRDSLNYQNTATIIDYITINASPIVNITQTCDENGKIKLDAGAQVGTQNFVSFHWSNDSTTQKITVVKSGIYSVTVYNEYGCAGIDTINFTKYPLPSKNINIIGAQTICSGQSVSLEAGYQTGDVYHWTLNTSVISGAATSIYTAAQTGDYNAEITNPNGCTVISNTIRINVNPLPIANAGNDIQICSGNKAILKATGGISYTWSNGTKTDTVTVKPLQTTTYTVTVTDNNGCTATANVVVTVFDTKPVIIQQPVSQTLCEGNNVNFIITATEGETYQWEEDGTNIPEATNPIFTINGVQQTNAGNYSCEVTNVCGSTISDAAKLTVNPAPAAIITNEGNNEICTGIIQLHLMLIQDRINLPVAGKQRKYYGSCWKLIYCFCRRYILSYSD